MKFVAEGLRRPVLLMSMALAAAGLLSASYAMDQSVKAADAQGWGQWQALGQGFMARRREAVAETGDQQQASFQVSTVSRQTQSWWWIDDEQDSKPDDDDSDKKDERKARNDRVNSLWLMTAGEGLQRVAIDDLALQLGVESKNVRRSALRGSLVLTTAEDEDSISAKRPVSWYYDKESDEILFIAEAYDTLYSEINAYQFSMSKERSDLARPMRKVKGKDDISPVVGSIFRDTVKFEEEPDYLFMTWAVTDEPAADYWFWDYLYAARQNKRQLQVELALPNPAPTGEAEIRIRMRGGSDVLGGDDHSVKAELNGQPIGSPVVWDGFEEVVLRASFDQSLLDPAGSNLLTLSTQAPTGTAALEILDDIEVEYQRYAVAEGGRLVMHDVDGGVYTIEGFSSSDILVMEKSDSETALLGNTLVEPDGNGGWQVSFYTEEGMDYFAQQTDVAEAPQVLPKTVSDLNSKRNRVDYLIIAPREFEPTATALAELRSDRYAKVKIAWVEDIYSEFSAGRADPAAFKRFMTTVRDRWSMSPSVVVLLGKGTLDQKNRMGVGDNYVPIVLYSALTAAEMSDAHLLGYEGVTPFELGRIPIVNNQEGLAYVEKLKRHAMMTPGNEVFSAVLIADNPDVGGNFHANMDRLADVLTSDYAFNQVSTLYFPDATVADIRGALTDSSTWETGYVSYNGHGSFLRLGEENFMQTADTSNLRNTVYPVFTALTCAVGQDLYPGYRSFAASLVLNPQGGAIASFTPVGWSLDDPAVRLGDALVEGLYGQGMSIGGASRYAKQQMQSSIPASMLSLYSVIGDPAVQPR